MSKGCIIIVDPSSTGENFLLDIFRRGFRPVGIWSNRNSIVFEATKAGREDIEKRFNKIADFFTECDTYEETLNRVKAYSPKFIIPGAELGVELAAQLSNDLGLRGNPIDRLPYMTNKYLMNQTLLENGIRGIRGKLVHDLDEIIAFYREQGLRGCVLKPYRGAGSFGVRICMNEEELKSAYDEVFDIANVMNDGENVMLMQEKIEGKEYVVNTVSCDGQHKITAVWKYTKKTVEGGGHVYDTCESVCFPEIGYTALVNYTFDVLNALGIRNGNVHTELMADEKGPVLIEVNARVMGGGMEADFIDRSLGHHETDVLLDTYLHPEKFAADIDKVYIPSATALIKFIISGKNTGVKAVPVRSLMKHLKSFYKLKLHKHVSDCLDRTVDLETSPAQVYLINEDYGQLKRDLDLIERIENEYFDLMFTQETAKAGDMPGDLTGIEDLIKSIDPVGGVLVVSNEKRPVEGVVCVDADELESEAGGYEYGILDMNYREDEDYEEIIDSFFMLADKVRKGGYIVVPKRSYWHLPYQIKAVEAMSEIGGFFVEAAVRNTQDSVIIRKMN